MAIAPTTRIALASLGLVLSLYAVYVEHKIEHLHDHPEEDEEFTALCDIKAIGASCSDVFSLPQGKLLSYFGIIPKGHVLDLPNAVLGACFYLQQLFFGGFPTLVAVSFATSVFLAYQLTFVLGDLCILCWTTHVINTTLFVKTVVPLFLGEKQVSKKKTV